MTVEDCFELGYVLRPHGLKGELMLALEADEPEAYAKCTELYLNLPHGLVPYRVEGFNVVQQGERAIAKLKGLAAVEQAEPLKGAKVYLPLTALPELDDDQFYYHDIVGYTVVDQTQGGAVVGTVGEVYELPQQTMLGVLVGGTEALVPLHDDFLVQVDKGNRRLVMQLPEGLLDVYLGGDDAV